MTMYRNDCEFRKAELCKLRDFACRPKKDAQDDLACELYGIEWSAESLKHEMNVLKERIRIMVAENMTIKKAQTMHDMEKRNKDDKRVMEYKKTLRKIQDLTDGHGILEKAYKKCVNQKTMNRRI